MLYENNMHIIQKYVRGYSPGGTTVIATKLNMIFEAVSIITHYTD